MLHVVSHVGTRPSLADLALLGEYGGARGVACWLLDDRYRQGEGASLEVRQ